MQQKAHPLSKKKVIKGIAHIQCTFNNTIITITTLQGDTLTWASSGTCGFKGTRKKTFIAAKQTLEHIAQVCLNQGMKELSIRIKGTGFGRKAIIKSLWRTGLKIRDIQDVTPISHNGCRLPKKRRN